MRLIPTPAFGNGMIDYSIPLIVFVLAGGLMTYYTAMPARIAEHFQAEARKGPDLQDRVVVRNYTMVNMRRVVLEDAPEEPEIMQMPMGTVELTTDAGTVVIIKNYPTDPGRVVEKEGANEVTRYLVGNLDQLTAQLEEHGELTPSQSGLLKDLAAQGHRLARIEAAVEKAAHSLRAGQGLREYSVSFDGRQAQIEELVGMLGFKTSPPYSDKSGPIRSVDIEDTLKLNAESAKLVHLLQEARKEGALNDPAVARFVENLVSKMLYLSESVKAGSVKLVEASQPGAQNYSRLLLAEIARYDACRQPASRKRDLFCP